MYMNTTAHDNSKMIKKGEMGGKMTNGENGVEVGVCVDEWMSGGVVGNG